MVAGGALLARLPVAGLSSGKREGRDATMIRVAITRCAVPAWCARGARAVSRLAAGAAKRYNGLHKHRPEALKGSRSVIVKAIKTTASRRNLYLA